MKHKNRSLYTLIALLLALVFPIVYEYLRYWPAMGVVGAILMFFGLGISGPLLIMYSLLVYLFSDSKEKKILSVLALMIGLSWVIYMMYTMSTGVD